MAVLAVLWAMRFGELAEQRRGDININQGVVSSLVVIVEIDILATERSDRLAA